MGLPERPRTGALRGSEGALPARGHAGAAAAVHDAGTGGGFFVREQGYEQARLPMEALDQRKGYAGCTERRPASAAAARLCVEDAARGAAADGGSVAAGHVSRTQGAGGSSIQEVQGATRHAAAAQAGGTAEGARSRAGHRRHHLWSHEVQGSDRERGGGGGVGGGGGGGAGGPRGDQSLQLRAAPDHDRRPQAAAPQSAGARAHSGGG
mmetsp:Transcript_19044/g.42450  ORF Transcript_19044/g.42450 Transcript_19044/m.42450 type:complete len:209 (+) Transcript_19044:1924-2550(+)